MFLCYCWLVALIFLTFRQVILIHPLWRNRNLLALQDFFSSFVFIFQQYGDFDWSPTIQGYILGSGFVGYFLTQFVAGKLSEIFGCKWLIFSGLFVASATTFVTPFVSWWNVYVLIVVQGIRGMGQVILREFIFKCVNKFKDNQMVSDLCSVGIITLVDKIPELWLAGNRVNNSISKFDPHTYTYRCKNKQTNKMDEKFNFQIWHILYLNTYKQTKIQFSFLTSIHKHKWIHTNQTDEKLNSGLIHIALRYIHTN